MTLLPRLAQPYEPSDLFFAAATLTTETAREIAVRRVTTRWTRPADGYLHTRIGEPRLVFFPYWRVWTTLRGAMVISYGPYGGRGNASVWGEAHDENGLVGGIAKHDVDGMHGYVMLCARSDAPVASDYASCFGTAPGWHIPSTALVRVADAARDLPDAAEVVDADVGANRVHDLARKVCQTTIEKGQSLRSQVLRAPGIDAVVTHFVLVPHYWLPYEYEGEAARGQAPGFFVAVHGRGRMIVGERHPSKLRAVAGRLRRILSFDPSSFR